MRGAQENIFYSLWAQPKSSFPPDSFILCQNTKITLSPPSYHQPSAWQLTKDKNEGESPSGERDSTKSGILIAIIPNYVRLV